MSDNMSLLRGVRARAPGQALRMYVVAVPRAGMVRLYLRAALDRRAPPSLGLYYLRAPPHPRSSLDHLSPPFRFLPASTSSVFDQRFGLPRALEEAPGLRRALRHARVHASAQTCTLARKLGAGKGEGMDLAWVYMT
jgi:hypothetical protein